jgi:hypothetical protein
MESKIKGARPLQHTNGKLDREEMVRIINAGGSVRIGSQVIDNLADLPPLEDLTDDPETLERAAQAAEERAQKALEEAEALRGHRTNPGAKRDRTPKQRGARGSHGTPGPRVVGSSKPDEAEEHGDDAKPQGNEDADKDK